LAGAVLDHDPQRALALLGEAVEQGLQLGELLDQLIDYWRDLMVANCAGVENQSLSVTGKHRESLREQAERLTSDTILAGLDVLVGAKNRMRFTSHGRVLLEMALVRLARMEDLVALSQLAQWVASAGGSPPVARPSAPANQAKVSPSPAALAEKKKPADDARPTIPIILTKDSLPEIWQQVLSQVGFILANTLKKAQDVAIFGPNALVLRVPATYNAPGDQYLDANRLAKVEEALTKTVGQPCTVKLEYVGKEANGSPQVDPTPALSGSAKRERQRSEIAQLPLIGKAMDLLDGQIMHVDEDFGALAADERNPGKPDAEG
jgi:DNA polymerase-3 subunit gamma/tau